MGMQYLRTASQGAYRLRGANQQAATRDFLFQAPSRLRHSLSDQSIARPAPVSIIDPGLCTLSFAVNNRSGSAGVLGYGYCWKNAMWNAGQWTNATTTYTDDTADAQGNTADSFPLGIAVASDAATDGWVVVSRRPFSWMSVDVTTASATNTTYNVGYSNAAGDDWTAITSNQELVSTALFSGTTTIGTGEHIFCWNPPSNWGPITTLLGLTQFVGMYAFRVTITAATPSVLALAGGIEIGSMIFSAEAIADNATGSEDNITYQDFDAIGVVALIPAATIGSNVDFACFPCG